ncbi:hypothetical protein BH20CHL2_BH20CHL2_06890 [soil metagenome]
MPGAIHTRLPRRGSIRRLRVNRPSTWWPTLATRQDEAFHRIWQALRLHEQFVPGEPAPSDWQERGSLYALCAIPLTESSGLHESLEPLRATLDELSFVHLYPGQRLVIPIQELGFIVDSPSRPDEISLDLIQEFLHQAEIPVTDFPAFRVKVGGFNSFLDVPFLDIHDDGWCNRMHQRLRDFVSMQPDDSFAYLPHLVLGEYTAFEDIGSFPAQMAPWRDRQFGEFVADRLDIIGISTSDESALPEILHSFELGHERGPAETIASPSKGYR